MKVINFKNEPKNNPFSPEWNYFMCETQTKDINFIEELEEIPVLRASEQQVRDKVLDAHKVLMGLNSKNREEFKNLVRALECEETG